MNIVAFFNSTLHSGGVHNQSLSAILQTKRVVEGKHSFRVATYKTENIEILASLGVEAFVLSVGFWDRVFSLFSTSTFFIGLARRFKLLSTLETQLKDAGADLVYFLSQDEQALFLRDLNYVFTVMDICHREYPEFPELRGGEIAKRDELFRRALPAASMVIVNSEEIKDKLCSLYGINENRTCMIPFSISPFMGKLEAKPVLNKEWPADFFFYPAQFWAHKNHIRILEALVQLKNENLFPNVVFVGSDKNSARYVKACVQKMGLEKQVFILGFVSSEELDSLYRTCRAVVMPTYFGPTNIPPLETWYHRKPLIYSTVCASQAGDAAILVNPDSVDEVAIALKLCYDAKACADLVTKGTNRYNDWQTKVAQSDADLAHHFKLLSGRIR